MMPCLRYSSVWWHRSPSLTGASRRKKIVFQGALCLLILASIESVSAVVVLFSKSLLRWEIPRTRDVFQEQSERIRRLLDPDPRRREAPDPTLGWRYKAGYRTPRDQINAQGLRSVREYAETEPPATLRVAAFGDSFVYGNEVRNEDSWPALMEGMFPQTEVLNYGVGGYGADQAYLRFLDQGAQLHPHIVVIGFFPDMLRRVVNVYRRFISHRENVFAKPRFLFGARGQLSLLPNPLPRSSDYEKYLRRPQDIVELGKHDYWYEPAVYENPLYDYSATIRLFTTLWVRAYKRYLDRDGIFRGNVFNENSSAFRIQMMLLEAFVEEVKACGALPIVVIFPDKNSIEGAERGQPTVFAPLVDHLKAKAINYFDLTAAFLAAVPYRVEDWFMVGGHYSPAGNRVVASWLGREIQARAATLDRAMLRRC